MNTEAQNRIKRLQRSIFWRDALGRAINLVPFCGGLIHLFILSSGDVGWGMSIAIFSLGITAFMFSFEAGEKAVNPFFGMKFAVEESYFSELKKERIRAALKAREEDKRKRKLEIIDELERDMRLTGFFQDNTKETP